MVGDAALKNHIPGKIALKSFGYDEGRQGSMISKYETASIE